MAKRRVVVTGLGVATPIGIGVEPFWDALIDGRCGIRRVSAFDPSGLASQVGGELPEFQLADCIPKGYRKSAKVMSRDITIAVLCAYHAVVDAGLRTKCLIERGDAAGPPNVDSTRFGANIGAGLVCADLSELAGALSTAVDPDGKFSLTRWGAEGMTNLTPLWLLKFLPNMLACHVTIVHDAQAPSNTLTCGEASSHLAIGEAYRTVARGAADVCICGGAESKINPMAISRPLLLNRLSTKHNDSPERACQPFGIDASGTVAAEGGGLVIIESLDHAQARGARIYAEIAGFGAANVISHWSQPDPDGTALQAGLRKALADAGSTPDRIDLVAPFGSGIPAFDLAEAHAWNAVFGERLERIPAITTRAATGNCGAGAGAIDLAAVILSLHRNTVPASLNTGRPSGSSRFRFAQSGPQDAPIREAVSLAPAISGGQCAALVIRKYKE